MDLLQRQPSRSPGHRFVGAVRLFMTCLAKQDAIDFCLDLTGGDLTNSNQLQIWTCSKGNKNQVWHNVPVNGGSTPPPPPPPPSGSGRPLHHNGDTSKCVDVKGAVFANGTPVEMSVFSLSLGPLLRLTFYVYSFDCNGSNAQKWVYNDGNTKVQLAGTNFCLDATSGSESCSRDIIR
jgi:hypothetical protein